MLTDVDLDVDPGSTVALVGPNGAGKTTLLRMLATLVRPERGTLTIMGCELPDHAMTVRPMLGYLGHDPGVYLDLTPWQNLELFADLYGVPDRTERVHAALDEVGLLQRAHDSPRGFSRGMLQRLGLARLGLHAPELVLLDEPYSGLDAASSALVDRLVTGARTVVMVTHDIAHAVAAADQLVVLRGGRVVERVATVDLDAVVFQRRYAELVA